MCTTKTKCIYAPIKEPLTIDNITLADAIKLLEYPKILGKYEGLEIKLNKGKFGLYITWGDVKAQLEILPENIKIKDKENITLEEAILLIKDKRKNVLWEKTEGKVIYLVLKGPFGNYIDIKDTSKKIKKKTLKIPLKDIEEDKIKELTLEKIKELIKIGLENKVNRFKKKDKKDGIVDAKTTTKKAETTQARSKPKKN